MAENQNKAGGAKPATRKVAAAKAAAKAPAKVSDAKTEASPAEVAPKPVRKAETAANTNTTAKPRRKPARKPSAPRKITGETPMTTAAKKDAAKETFETISLASNEAVKEGFEKSMAAFNDVSAFQKDTIDAVIASATAATKSVEELNSSMVAYAKKSMEDGVAAAKSMASAKSVQELIEIHADYTKSSLDGYLAEMNKTTDLMSGLFKESFKPLNDRMAAAVELMQSQR